MENILIAARKTATVHCDLHDLKIENVLFFKIMLPKVFHATCTSNKDFTSSIFRKNCYIRRTPENCFLQ